MKKAEDNYGVLLIGLEHPYYVHNAYALAVTLKQHDINLKIALVYDDASICMLDENKKKIFSHLIKCSPEILIGKNGFDVFKAKIHLDEFTPFDRTLYLDTDMVWNASKSPIELFDKLKGVSFTCKNYERFSTDSNSRITSQWYELSDIKKFYDIDNIYDISSELIYFEKTNIFKTARKIYSSNKMPVRKFRKGLPDEVWLSIAIEKTNLVLHETPFEIIYWQPYFFNRLQGHTDDFILHGNYYAVSFGGAWASNRIKKLTDHMKKDCFQRMGINELPYSTISKYDVKELDAKII